jgi:hypothetical protein
MESLLRVPVAMLKKVVEESSNSIIKESQTPRSISNEMEEPSMALSNPLQGKKCSFNWQATDANMATKPENLLPQHTEI